MQGMEDQGPLEHDGRNLALLVVLALVLGIYLAVATPLISRDGVLYINMARTLSHDPLRTAQTYPAGYPFLLHVAHRVGVLFGAGDTPMAWVIASLAVTLLLRLLALIPLYLLTRMLVGARRGFWAVLILIVLPYPAHNGSDVLREWPFLFFLALGVWLTVLALRRRRWWLFGLIGLDTGLGYLIRPECAQLIVYGLVGLGVVVKESRSRCSPGSGVPARTPIGAAVLLLLGFAIPAAPYVAWAGLPTARKLDPPVFNRAPVIASVGGRTVRYEPLRFEVAAGARLEIPIEAFDPDGDSITYSVVAVPVGTRPVYRLCLSATGDSLWTISDRQKSLLLTRYRPGVWEYDGIGGYAYAEPNGAPGLLPVYGFWSPVLDRHFYTLSESQRKAVVEGEPEHQWQSEGIAFYAFGEDRPPADAIAVYRCRDRAGERTWAVEGDENLVRDAFAWYAHAGSAPPAGMTVEGNLVRWRPGLHQRGLHQLNLIVDDSRLQSCQLVQIDVGDAQPMHAGVLAGSAQGSLKAFGHLVNSIFRSIGDNLMQYFLAPLCVGLWFRLRREAGAYERALMFAIVSVNVLLMLGRYLCIQPVMSRRYSLGLVALTMGYVPVGLDVIAHWLARLVSRQSRQAVPERTLQRRWFCLLVAIGVGVCVPKLLSPGNDKDRAFLAAARWLRHHTTADEVIAAADRRIGFYAERTQVPYEQSVDLREVDYIVTVSCPGEPDAAPADWVPTFSTPLDSDGDSRLTIRRRP
ncbi:MAG TPA: glycosyltransferase family 39 protein [Sedimentisphaerales bacterium]|nr:glycosyltransferase family 39 protein [Sedimentisphaerales bacterium]HRS10526.1 glycosyltransferase family 39 protein [Sedimentisphaerales bacterium]HRV47250.1 glycosyltransferase family 39 protein [Sedimentisphaerales bacterium]